MKYLAFKLHNKILAIELNDNYYKLVPTQINKMMSLKNKENELIDGIINYKNKMYYVLDFSKIYNFDNLKKFDGLIFITEVDTSYAFKFEGFYRIVDELLSGMEIIDIYKYL